MDGFPQNFMPDKQTILLADDDASIRNMLAEELESSYDVLVAKDGIDAICIYEHNIARVRAIVTDLQMPRLDGGLVAEWVHHINPRLPVIVMSGQIRNTDLEELLQNPTVTFLAKPFDPHQLETLLDVALEDRLNEAA
jgi:DNA-binding NtrC family response regulator